MGGNSEAGCVHSYLGTKAVCKVDSFTFKLCPGPRMEGSRASATWERLIKLGRALDQPES